MIVAATAKQCCKGYGLVLMDCEMPVLDGFEATARLVAMMEKKEIPATPIVGLSAFTGEVETQHCHDVGMVETLAKPLSYSKLQDILRRFHII
jgi:CheY-like chemotaxis protein